MKNWQSHTALKRVRDEALKLTGDVAAALEAVLSTPVDEARQFDGLAGPGAAFSAVPGILRLLECEELSWLADELSLILQDIREREQSLAEADLVARLQQAYQALSLLPALLEDVLVNDRATVEIYPLLNRLRQSRGAALVINSQVLKNRQQTSFRRQHEQQQEKFLDVLSRQAVFCGKACRRLKDCPGDARALEVLTQAVANVELLLRDFKLGTAWAMANGLVREAGDPDAVQRCTKVLALMAHSLLQRCRTPDVGPDAPLEANIARLLHDLYQEPGEMTAAAHLVRLCHDNEQALLADWQAALNRVQMAYFGQGARQTAMRLLKDDIDRLLDRINQAMEMPPVTRGMQAQIQQEVVRLRLLLEFLGKPAVELPTVFSPDEDNASPEESLLALARALFIAGRELDGLLVHPGLASDSEGGARGPDVARMHAWQAIIQELEGVIDLLDRAFENNAGALEEAGDTLGFVAETCALMDMAQQSQQIALARDYVACLVAGENAIAGDTGFQTLCHLLINTLWYFNQLILGREADSAVYREKSAGFAAALGDCLEHWRMAQATRDPAGSAAEGTLPEQDAIVQLQAADTGAPQAEVAGIAGDDELRGIFVEEFTDILQSLTHALAQLRSAPRKTDLVRECARYFHTLKGSGRMVGASYLYDLGLAMEKLFDSLGEQTPVTPQILDFCNRVTAFLPGLKDSISNGESTAPAPGVINALCEEAGVLLHATVPAAALHDTDPVIAGFLREARDLCGELVLAKQRWIHAADSHDRQQHRDHAVRLMHLLEGAAQSAGQTSAAELLAAMASIHAQADCSGPLPASLVNLTQDCDDYLEALLQGLARGHTPGYGEALLQAIANEAGREQPGAETAAGSVPVAADETSAVPPGTEAYGANQDHAPADVDLTEAESADAVETASRDEPEDVVDDTLVQIFREEAQELLQALDELYLRWQEDASDEGVIAEYLRILHTLKGSAALVSNQAMSSAAHDFETFVLQVRNQGQGFDAAFFAGCDRRQLGLHELCQEPVGRSALQYPEQPAGPELVQDDSEPETTLPLLLLAREDCETAAVPETAASGRAVTAQVPVLEERVEEMDLQETKPAAAEPVPVSRDAQEPAGRNQNSSPTEEQVRVSSQLLRYLLNEADEISFSRNRMEQNFQAIGVLLMDMDEKLAHLRSYVKKFEESAVAQGRQEEINGRRVHEEFDALEMDRYTEMQEMSLSLSEDYEDLQDIRQNLAGKLKEIDNVLGGQRRLTNSLQDGLITSQMLPFASIVPRLRRLVRQVSRELGKQVRLEIENHQGHMDKHVLQAVITPFEHLLRNAIDHGIETPAERKQAGKEEQAVIAIRVVRQGASIVVELKDDGGGINLDKVRQRARERGLLDAKAEIGDTAACQMIFQPGFSTADAVSTISGRGVGLDVVKSEISQIGGSVEVKTQAGRGTTFILHLPLTSSLNRALLFRIQERPFVVLMNTLDGVLVEKLANVYKKQQDDRQPAFEYGGKSYEYLYLGKLINPGMMPRPDVIESSIPLLLVTGREKNYALHIDAIIENRDLVVKSFGRQFSTMPGIGGGVIMPDGNVAIVLDLPSLVGLHEEDRDTGLDKLLVSGKTQNDKPGGKTIMVVDDSVTVRKVTAKILERNGLNVITAKDGLEAVELLEQFLPDIILLDIEMPRMDGFEVAAHIRKQPPPLRDVPIIMITSRIGEKHRSRAEKIGVNEYLCKPFQESNLLEHIDRY